MTFVSFKFRSSDIHRNYVKKLNYECVKNDLWDDFDLVRNRSICPKKNELKSYANKFML